MYEDLDKAIVAAVKSGKNRFGDILASVMAVASKADASPYRLVDRRLQALRKKKTLKFKSKDGWTVS